MRRNPPNDTHPAFDEIRVEAYRRMTPTQKLEIVCALNDAVRALALADIRRRHPHAGERELMGLYQPLTEEQLAWAVSRTDPELKARLDAVLDDWRRQGVLEPILDRWIPVRVEIGR